VTSETTFSLKSIYLIKREDERGMRGACVAPLYKEMARQYPCFGHASKMPNLVWWKTCVRDSFVRVRKSDVASIALGMVCSDD
jgi:predicted acetyltransferase